MQQCAILFTANLTPWEGEGGTGARKLGRELDLSEDLQCLNFKFEVLHYAAKRSKENNVKCKDFS
jgi:hypothetical protein